MKPTPDSLLAAVLIKLQHTATVAFTEAAPIPAEVNHSSAFLAHEREHVFLKRWICIGREDEVANHGDYVSAEIAGVSVFVVRQKSGSIGAFINSCAHRRARLLSEKSGQGKKITCPYHAWSYDLEGQLIAAPYMEMKSDFQQCEHRLHSIHMEVWEGFVYVSLADRPETSIGDTLVPFRDNVVGRYDMSRYRTMIRDSMTWQANWKNLIENFTESYHVPMVHQKTFAQHGKPLQNYIMGEDSDHYCYHYAPQTADSGLGAAHPDNVCLTGEWRRTMVDFCIFPNHLVTLMPDYLWWISVLPQGTDQFSAEWGVAFPPEVLADVDDDKMMQWLADFKSYMDIANNEDRLLVEALHQGTVAENLPDGTYHPLERNLWQFHRYLARTCASDCSGA